jgi:type IX secretion system PorP/SprF family membrane protein
MNFNRVYIVLLLFISQVSFSQEGLPVYSDYLSDNYYLIHPSMAGASNCAKLRFTGRQQWFGQEDAPSLQTLSFNGKIGEKSGGGVILINDKNGYHSQKGMKLTYAHHIMFSRDEIDLNQFSFGMTAGFFQSVLDETSFLLNQPFDPNVYGGMQQKASYFNVDFGMSYNYLDFYTHLTVKNALASQRKLYSEYEPVDLKSVLFSAGYTFGDKERLLWEPSFMLQSIIQTRENTFDLNLKVYKQLDFGKLWGALSYRRSLDGAEYVEGRSTTSNQKLQYLTPIVGLNYKNFMFSYTYSQLLGNVQFDTVGFHQITLGFNLFCQEERYHCNCPAIN